MSPFTCLIKYSTHVILYRVKENYNIFYIILLKSQLTLGSREQPTRVGHTIKISHTCDYEFINITQENIDWGEIRQSMSVSGTLHFDVGKPHSALSVRSYDTWLY